jgi:hypothetical protein
MQWLSLLRRPTLRPAVYLLIAIGGLLLTTVVLYFSGWVSFAFAARLAVLVWTPYLLTAPLVWRFSGSFPIAEGKVIGNILVHAGGTVVFVVLCEMLHMGLIVTILGPPELPFPPRFELFPRGVSPPPDFPAGPPPFNSPIRQRPLPPGFVMKAQFHIAVYGLIVITSHLVSSMQRLRQRERQQALLQVELTQARLQSLQSQLHPHFLFNTINTISALIYERPKTADEMLANLSDLLRVTLDQKQQPETTMENELLVLGFYLDIQLVRFGHWLRIEQNVPAEVLDALVPAFILQPLVENAIEHGISLSKGPGIITLYAEKANNHLVLQVRDNGPGLVPDQLKAIGNGIGLSNTRNRLLTLYGRESTLHFHSETSKGSCVEIRIPFHLTPVSVAAEPGTRA